VGLLPTDRLLAQRTLLEAVAIAVNRGAAAQSEFMRSVGATDAHLSVPPSSVAECLLHAFSTHARAGYAAAVPEYHTAVARCRDAPPQELAPWTNLIAVVMLNTVWDDAGCELLLQRVADWARSSGALLPLSYALIYLAVIAAWRGQLQSGLALNAQALDVLSAAAHYAPSGLGANLDAIAGRDAEVSAKVAPALEGMGIGQLGLVYSCRNALVDLQIGRARYDQALHHAQVLFDADPMVADPGLLPDMVEAAVRVGNRTAAEQALARLEERATAAGTPWALGLLARSHALMAVTCAEGYYVSALELFGTTRMELQRARSSPLWRVAPTRAAAHRRA
jgi:hypothetical protein